MNAKHAATTAETSERTSGFSMAPRLEESGNLSDDRFRRNAGTYPFFFR